MCGIAGQFAYHSDAAPVDKNELITIRDAMISRGPDGEGLWVSPDDRVGLAHRRLSIIDLSETGAQPMQSADGRYTITFNGEIYNYQPLRADLIKQGHRFYSTSDTEVLLHLYAHKGPQMVHDLRGMYAFAVHDQKTGSLFLARDPFGIKPLYVCDTGKSVYFASQVKALLKSRHVDTTFEPAGHVGFFLLGSVPEPFTFYRSIKPIAPGAGILIDASGQCHEKVRIDILEEMRQLAQEDSSRLSSTSLREMLHESVLDHFVADVPVGVFLSAGLDSATVVGHAAEKYADSLRTITLGFKEFTGTLDDEAPLAENISAHYGTSHQTLWVSQQTFHEHQSRILDAMDQPTIDGINTYFVSYVAAQSGLKVALSGLGGDEFFGGYDTFRLTSSLPRLLFPFRWMPWAGTAFRKISSPFFRQFTTPKYASLPEYGHSFSGAYFFRRDLFMPWELPSILDAEFVQEGLEQLNILNRLDDTGRDLTSAHLRTSALELCWYMRNQLLRDSDWASMAHSLEIRVPFVDYHLFKKLLPLMGAQHPPSKLDMAQTMSKPLPRKVMERKKTGFRVPVHSWLMQNNSQAVKGESRLRGWAKMVYGHFMDS